jgi:hypothetical protein
MTMTPVARSNATPLEPAYLERAEFSKPSSFAAAEAERPSPETLWSKGSQ